MVEDDDDGPSLSPSGGGALQRSRSELVPSPTHKRQRSAEPKSIPPMDNDRGSAASGDLAQCSFQDIEDDNFVYQEEAEAPAARPEPARDPSDFVNSFRAQIEKSMALIEQEVAMLDRLERAGRNPLIRDNVAEVQRLLQERMNIAARLQSELRSHLACS
mmetsp:Transcript_20732/g.57136  ORF Transcript_20732/g.57136 Transcript_20732/m.57136 type:complete len:160 (+) Transcript_20732:27-506(+)